jgi:chromosome segregation protein
MTLKSLELASFKSFGKKSTLAFNTPLTAVVGPNGSGKSNIVEAIRFVLGEQSMKSLRGKGGVDLIFKGSKMMSSANRASVTITFDNSKKIFNFTNSGLGVSLDFDEISISREVFADGGNTYSINGTEVRLKDVVDLLASVNIGSSGHHIISQGEADRVLNASPKDRRAMIEDALGLKVYQYRIKESERKLEKTAINMKEVQSIRREIAPHINFLKKQVEKVEKSHALRDELNGYYSTYLSTESAYIALATKQLTHQRRVLNEKLLNLEERLSKLPVYDSQNVNKESSARAELAKEEVRIRRASEELSRTLGRLEGMIDALRAPKEEEEQEERVISYSEWSNLLDTCLSEIDSALGAGDKENIISILSKLKNNLLHMKNSGEKIKSSNLNEGSKDRIRELENQKEDILRELKSFERDADKNREDARVMAMKEKEVEAHLRDSERVRYEILGQKNEVTSDLHSLSYEDEKLANIKNAFEEEVREASALIGMQVLKYAQNGFKSEGASVDSKESRIAQEDLKKKIERIKIKLEDAGIGNGADILKEYNETLERDQFLERELADLATSSSTLTNLITELKDTLDIEFKNGIAKINKEFQNFFSLMFGGGNAHLSVVVEQKRQKKDEDLDMEGEEMEEENFELEKGVNIDVSLPQKKVKDLHMLSGGERSLTSIALLFAMSQVNPPPFLVLDETDAALDEANSRKYGDMLENLSKFSQLIVVTHNRETMSRAEVLYGVTVGSDGASKLLSISLVDANVYAK